ncbi:unnamed protein product [Brassicogethes aeneus]|uniref:SH2 domain-containing protein n=1 Tax=Brassicogethes aeneus TaxID=1431903 RepID=A0A9P0FMJ6_BRAAE|nr:unnamed protein product [Brassicogethes aeneus]
MKISREQAVDLLKDKQNGTFIVRPSSRANMNSMSIIQDGKVYHLKIGLRKNGRISLGNEKDDEATFKNLNILINYYISNTLYLYSEERNVETLLIPYH